MRVFLTFAILASGVITLPAADQSNGQNAQPKVNNVHRGQRVTVPPEAVTDWMFLKNGKLMGAYTTRVLYARLSPDDKAEFDKHAAFKVQ